MELDIDPDEFEMLEPQLKNGVPMLQFADRLANGAGYCKRLATPSDGEGSPLVIALVRSLLAPMKDPLMRSIVAESHHKHCFSACYDCIQRYGNRMFHGLLDWRLGISFLRLLLDASWAVGLDGDFTSYEICDWFYHAELMRDNLCTLKAEQYEKVDIKLHGVKLPAIKRNHDYIALTHPFWDEAYVLEHLPQQTKIFTTFEALRRPLRIVSL